MSNTQRRLELDGLRTIAVFPVIISHAWPAILPGGHLGVDIFFVLSGYLIAGLLFDQIKSDNFSFLEFYRRRGLRLMPAFFLVLFATLVLSWLLHIPRETALTTKTAIFAAVSASNLYLPFTGGYFSVDASANPLLHTWSLAVEEQFYLIFPLLLLLTIRYAPRLLTLFLLGAILSSLVFANFLYAADSPWAHYSPAARAWQLLLGAFLALTLAPITTARRCRLSVVAATMMSGIALTAILLSFYFYDDSFTLAAQFIVCVATLALIWSSTRDGNLISKLLSFRGLVYIGMISYSLYLWHQPVIAFGRLIYPDHDFTFMVFAAATSVILAALTYHVVETPIRYSRMSNLRCAQVLVALLGGLMIFTLVGIKSDWFSSRYPYPLIAESITHPDQIQSRKCSYWGPLPEGNMEFCVFPSRLTDIAPRERVAIWGDSHAMALTSGFINMDRPYDVVHLGMSGCDLHLQKSNSHRGTDCLEKHKSAIARILSDDSIKVVVFHSKWQIEKNSIRSESVIKNLMNAIQTIQSSGREVALVSTVPIYEISVPEAMLRSKRINMDIQPSTTATEHQSDKTRIRDDVLDVARQLNVPVIYPENILCKSKLCRYEQDGNPLYYDDDHLSVFGARLLAEAVHSLILSVLESPHQ